MNHAPIALFTYNRLDHTKKTLESLSKNVLASESSLIVFSDGAKYDDTTAKVSAVRDYLRLVTGFKSIEIHERQENFGLARNILDGVTNVINRFGKVIVVEDDLVTSKFFLKYMNDALQKYEHEDKVISVHGYIYPVSNTLPGTFFLRGADCWGWATWKRGWDLLETNGEYLMNALKERGLEKRFNFYNSYPYMRMLEDQVAGKNNSWAILWYASAFLKDKLTLYPGVSLVRNIGNDSTGTHNPSTAVFDVNIADAEISLDPAPVIDDNEVAAKAIARYFRSTRPFVSKLKQSVLNIFRR